MEVFGLVVDAHDSKIVQLRFNSVEGNFNYATFHEFIRRLTSGLATLRIGEGSFDPGV